MDKCSLTTRLEQYYALNAPEKVSEIPSMVIKFEYHEGELFEKLAKKIRCRILKRGR